MTLVGWLADNPGYIGGAELTASEFRKAAPDHVEVIDCPSGGVVKGLDRYVIHNCVSYKSHELTLHAPAFKYWHDVGPHLSTGVWEALAGAFGARHVCVSPLQREHMKLGAEIVPPAIDLEPFREAAENAGERSGAVAIGPWQNPAKAPDAAAEWAAGNGGIDFYGEGPFAPEGSVQVAHEDLPEVLARYETYVHLPREIEPFGRSTVEAYAAGCELVVNRLVGARWWIENEPERLESAATDFWDLVVS